jgi:hypothetical protein
MTVTYYEIYHNCRHTDFLINKRLGLVRYANGFGIKPASRYFRTSSNTVKRWCRRYAILGIKGLYNRPCTPKRCTTKIAMSDIKKISSCVKDSKKKKKCITVKNVRKKTDIFKYSDTTINHYINKALNNKKRNIIKPKTNEGSIELYD